VNILAVYNLDEKSGFMGMFSIKSASKIIKKNDSIDFKHFNLFDFVKATVLEVNENSLKVHSNDKTPDINAFPGDHIVLNFSQGDEVYVLSGNITSIDSVDPLEFVLNVKKIDKLKDLRKLERFCVSLKADIKMIGVTETRFGIVKNLSLAGAKINCKDDIMMEDTVEITIRLDKVNKCIFKGRVVRKNTIDNYFEYGMEISEMTETYTKNLYHFIFTL
jgi:hypothetical protein